MSNEAAPVAVPRPASTVLIVRDDPFEVLLVLRSAASSFFPAAYVFPGGRVEEHDHDPVWRSSVEHSADLDDEERAYRIAAVRETHEEAALLLAEGLTGTQPRPVPDAIAFQRLVSEIGARLLLDDVVPYAHWITPPIAPKRFDTRFYLTRAPEGQLAAADAMETDDATWMSPDEAVERAQEGSLALPPPTYLNLMLLSQSRDSEEAIHAARRRTVIPIVPEMVKSTNGVARMRIPLAAGYGVEEYDLPEYSTAAESRPRPPR